MACVECNTPRDDPGPNGAKKWACPKCTLLNDSAKGKCISCGAAKPTEAPRSGGGTASGQANVLQSNQNDQRLPALSVDPTRQQRAGDNRQNQGRGGGNRPRGGANRLGGGTPPQDKKPKKKSKASAEDGDTNKDGKGEDKKDKGCLSKVTKTHWCLLAISLLSLIGAAFAFLKPDSGIEDDSPSFNWFSNRMIATYTLGLCACYFVYQYFFGEEMVEFIEPTTGRRIYRPRPKVEVPDDSLGFGAMCVIGAIVFAAGFLLYYAFSKTQEGHHDIENPRVRRGSFRGARR